MEYVTPIDCGGSNPERPYVDGCASMGQPGSLTPARFANLMLAEGRNLVEGAGLTLDPNNDAQWLEAVRTLALEIVNVTLTGSVAAFAMDTPPSCWLVCDGSAVSRTDYGNLFAAIGTTHGSGNGMDTFNLPDLRGEFIRGLDAGRGVDVGRSLGSSQMEAIREHQVGLKSNRNLRSITSTSTTDNARHGMGAATWGSNYLYAGDVGADETRPRNVALLYCIKT